MIFAHGFGTDQSMWRHVAPHFEFEYTTVLLDHVGSGRSERGAYAPSKYACLDDYARDIVEIGRELGCENAVLVGHSCGAMIGALASLKDAGMFGRLIMLAPSPRYIDGNRYRGGFKASQIDSLLTAIERDFNAWSAAMAPIFMGNTKRPQLTEELIDYFRQIDPDIAAQFAKVTFTSDCRPALKAVGVPSLALMSRHDPVVPTDIGKYLRKHLADCEVQTLATEDGHFSPLSDSEKVVGAMRRFLWLNRAEDERRNVKRSSVRWSLANQDELRLLRNASMRSGLSAQLDRPQRERLLLQRVGEFYASLGRVDMLNLGIQRWLARIVPGQELCAEMNVRTRDAEILRMLESCSSEGTCTAFGELNSVLLSIVARHEITARNSCLPAHLMFSEEAEAHPLAAPKDWFDYAQATEAELLFFIDALDREIMNLVSLRRKLVDWSVLLKDLVPPR